jgi:peptidoglycan/LPS O-acetylase OafA/YrhL
MKIPYRPEVDGLRAVAIIPVVLFHMGVPALAGGYVGVDVFFVISGYLISGIIVAGLETGTFTFRDFYIRRARRILPILLLVTAATLAVGTVLLWPIELADLARSALATIAFASNILFWSQAGYFGPEAHDQPLLHTWSIGVEEQFYLLFPVLILVLWRLGQRVVVFVLTLLLALSLGAAIWASWAAPSAGFYLFPFRAWELLLGVLLAVVRPPAPQGWLGTAFFVAGMAMIGAAVFTFTAEPGMPGGASLLPAVGTGLVIWSSESRGRLPMLVLGNPVATWIGKVSYGMYLWHWPLIVYLPLLGWTGGWADPVAATGFLLFLLALSSASFVLVESPLRKGMLLRGRVAPIAGSVSVLAVAAFATAVVATGGLPSRLTETEAGLFNA